MALFTNVKTKCETYRIQMHTPKYPFMTFSITVVLKHQIKKIFFSPEELENWTLSLMNNRQAFHTWVITWSYLYFLK